MPYEIFREEELKNRIAETYFQEFDAKKIIGNIDFCVSASDTQIFLWAEAKKGSTDLHKSIAQLILTIGKARTFDQVLPPAFLGAFDAEKIGFIPYSEIQEIFYLNDFNWNVAPSNHETREFIRTNFVSGNPQNTKIRIDKNNFITISHLIGYFFITN